MKVILREDIRSVGQAGEVVEVSPGFGRNYLLPQKKAVLATAGNLKELEKSFNTIQARRDKQKQEAQLLAERIGQVSLVLERETGEEEKLFGAVTSRHLSEALALQGFNIDHKLVDLKQPIRTLGQHEVRVGLYPGVDALLKVEVRKK
ncbi:MAG: 50S ribosomal protein L9 [Deltaproteobacteria bacterium]|nr:50S ribosomal protein L9 [Deltaproteobacteria bacterium]MBI2501452.1 50S ribosomal protein L9 [Deltaproteobacteria bacterium]MBI4196556.1 50S ribosomal protein L9 [Deltaproteobacteria bacterium]